MNLFSAGFLPHCFITMSDEDIKMSDVNQTEDFLSAEDLVSLRKPAEDPVRPVVGEKFYTRSEAQLDDKAVECALENHKDTLNKKRGARICDLMQADWNEELNASITSKLKGKFVQHMGRNINGKIALSPEESLFLLENGCIEIKNGEILMSTEEAYSVMLKKNMCIERYQVYSHLSQLGFIVVPHQTELGVTKYERTINLDKHQVKRKRKEPLAVVEEPEKKRLTFSGALSGKQEVNLSDVESQDTLTIPISNETIEPEIIEQEDGAKVVQLDMSVEDKDCHEVIECEESHTVVANGEEVVNVPNEEDVNKLLNPSVSDENQNEEAEPHCLNEVDSTRAHINLGDNKPDGLQSKELDYKSELTKPRPLNCVCSLKNGTGDQPGAIISLTSSPSEKPVICNVCKGHVIPSESKDIALEVGSASTTEASHPKNDIDVMDVDSQSTEVSCTSETSRDNFEVDSVNITNLNNRTSSNKSYCSVINGVNNVGKVVEDSNAESNFDVMSCSSSDTSESDVLSLEASDDSLSIDPCEEEEITLLEVTKKETKPLAVIDLLSDDEQEPTDALENDDEITVVKVCSGPSISNKSSPKMMNSRKFYDCKKEERASPPVNPKLLAPSLSVQFPELFRKDVVCVSRPPLNLLPSHVKPSKEVYVLDLKQRSEQLSQPQGRVWNSFRDLQDYQRSRRLNRHAGQSFSQFQNRDQGSWGNGNFGACDMQRDQKNSYGRRRPDLPEHNANGNLFNAPQRPFNGGPLPYNVPPAASMNSVVAIRHQDMNVSMVGNPGFPPLNANAIPPVQFPPSMSSFPPLGTAQIMAEVQRTAYSVATSMLSSMLGRAPPGLPTPHFSQFNAFQPPQTTFNYEPSNLFAMGRPQNFNAAFNNQSRNREHFSMQNNRRNFQTPSHRGRPFPCHYRNLPHKRSWSDVKSAVRDASQDNSSDIEEVPISPNDILWDESNICPLVKPGFRHEVSAVLKMLGITQSAKLLDKYNNVDRYLPTTSSLEISFDVYLPGFNYKKTCPDIPKHRIIVIRSTDPIPRYSEMAFLQRKWNDGALLQFAVVDNSDVSFHSFNNIRLPITIPHVE